MQSNIPVIGLLQPSSVARSGFLARICPVLPVLLLLIASDCCGQGETGIIELATLDFGAVRDHDGQVTMGLNDNILADPAGIHLGGYVSSGRLRIVGEPHSTVWLRIFAYDKGGLTLSRFETDAGTWPNLFIDLGPIGEANFKLGADLRVKSHRTQPGEDQPLYYVIHLIHE
ncbi:MAG: hypothetical protein ABIF77_13205 [bacterium]